MTRRMLMLALLLIGSVVISNGVVSAVTPFSKGNFMVFDSPDCTGTGNSPQVTVPFSVGGRNYPPNIELDIYATDKRTGERFGPFVMRTNSLGSFCAEAIVARPTQWKIDLVEPGSGFTDSKVVTVRPPTDPTTPTTSPVTTAPATTAPATTAPATTAPATTAPATTAPATTAPATTAPATTAPATTAPATTTTAPAATTTTVESEVPIDLIPVDPPDSWTLPGTGSSSGTPAALALVLVAVGVVATAFARRRA